MWIFDIILIVVIILCEFFICAFFIGCRIAYKKGFEDGRENSWRKQPLRDIDKKRKARKMKILVQFSGGKDSQACLIKAVNDYGKGKVTAVFCDTGWEHADTYTHIYNVCGQLGVELVTLKSKKYKDFVDMSIKKGRFPSTRARFCTSELKVIPMIDYILSQDDSFIIIQGIRANESKSKRHMRDSR